MDISPIQQPPRSRTHIFVGLDLNPARIANPAAVPRSSASYVRTRRGGEALFGVALRDAQSSAYRVKPGDTLSEIVSRHLKAQGKQVSSAELYTRVRDVARANGIADPDVIVPGQQIDLDAPHGQGGPRKSRAASSAINVPPIVPAQARGSASASRSIDEIVSGDTRISSRFGLRKDPIDGGLRHHGGIDIAAARGSAIYPVDEGVVTFSGWHGAHGKTVIVKHENGTETVYAHADALLVSAGQAVKTSDKIALIGSTGRSTGPHLHFEVRRAGVPVDPIAVFNES